MKKNIRNPKYLFFMLKKSTFWNPCIFAVYPIGVDIWLIGGEGVCTAHEKFTIMHINKMYNDIITNK